MKTIGDILKSTWRGRSEHRQLNVAQIISAANTILSRFFGLALSGQAQAVSLKNRTLHIACASAMVAQELKLREIDFLRELSQLIGRESVEKITYQTGYLSKTWQ